jgi:hypothetical protein
MYRYLRQRLAGVILIAFGFMPLRAESLEPGSAQDRASLPDSVRRVLFLAHFVFFIAFFRT